MKAIKYILIWLIAIVLTLATSVYQRITGPTHPFKKTINVNNKSVKLRLIRSHGGDSDAQLDIPVADKTVKAFIFYKKYPSNESFVKDSFKIGETGLTYFLPNQPPAGKLQYRITIHSDTETIEIPSLIIRFKGEVPSVWLVPHILLMFLAILFSFSAVMAIVFNFPVFKTYSLLAASSFLLGGLILGPIVQKFAFGDWWTGIPFGWDLTDNKTLFAAIFWVIAIIKNHKNPSKKWTIIACVVMILIYAIPHSLFGSELNHETGEVIQGVFDFPLLGYCFRKPL